MKRFYIAVLLFMLPIFVFMGGAEYAVRQIPNEYKYKNDWMNQHAEEVETLILGSSHAYDGINPDCLGKNAFNLAFPGQTLKFDNYLFFRWVNCYKNLRTVILPISYFSFFYLDMDQIRETYYSLYMAYPSSVIELEMLCYGPLKIKIEQYIEEKNISCHKNGWARKSLSDKDMANWGKDYITASVVRKQTVDSWDCIKPNYCLISEIASYCQKHGIKFVMVALPHTKGYNQHLDEKQLSKTLSLVSSLKQQYGLDFYDYREDSRFVDEDFFDESHLSDVGAEKFTKILMNDMSHNNYMEN